MSMRYAFIVPLCRSADLSVQCPVVEGAAGASEPGQIGLPHLGVGQDEKVPKEPSEIA